MNIKIEDLIEKLEQSYDLCKRRRKGSLKGKRSNLYRKPSAGEVDSKMDYSGVGG